MTIILIRPLLLHQNEHSKQILQFDIKKANFQEEEAKIYQIFYSISHICLKCFQLWSRNPWEGQKRRINLSQFGLYIVTFHSDIKIYVI